MEDLKRTLIARARSEFRNIRPCRGKEDISESFTTHNGKLVFWFNLEDQSTKILMADLDCN
jgi:hypothetical protein